MKSLFASLILVMSFAPSVLAQAPPTIVLSDTHKALWTPSIDNDVTFGTPAVPKLTAYVAELWLKANVTVSGTGANTTFTPNGPPALTFNWGKPTIVNNTQAGPPLKPLVLADTEYYIWLKSTGPAGDSTTKLGPAGPFGFPSVPAPARGPLGLVP